MNRSQVQKLTKQINRHMDRVANTRDKIDEFIDTATQLRDDCDDAYNHLVDARDALSRLV